MPVIFGAGPELRAIDALPCAPHPMGIVEAVQNGAHASVNTALTALETGQRTPYTATHLTSTGRRDMRPTSPCVATNASGPKRGIRLQRRVP